MMGKALKLFGWQNKIDISPSGLDDLKIVGILLSCFVAFVFLFVIPWCYGMLKLILMIF